jgi:glycosyltransferase involved in cell wall biosynthesis
MKIDVLANDGSPLGVTEQSIYGQDGRMGVGGAELAILTLLKGWHDAGHDVTFYNDPKVPNGSCFAQEPIHKFRASHERDVLIIFRSPNERSIGATGLKVWFSCDQFTVGSFKDFAPTVNKIVTISPFHSDYFNRMYGINNTIPIDLPIRTWEYEGKDIVKVPHRCIFTSMPDRGLMPLNAAWHRIVEQVPDASLVITSDWRLWTEWANEEQTRDYRMAFARQPNVIYRGAVNRGQLIDDQLKAELHLYPCVYDELFCISVAESQVAGAYPITSAMGAVETTNMGTVLPGNPYDPNWINDFIETVVLYLKNSDRELVQTHINGIHKQAMDRFSLDTILKQWNEKVFSHG